VFFAIHIKPFIVVLEDAHKGISMAVLEEVAHSYTDDVNQVGEDDEGTSW
jgi:hypothetical protein